MLRFLSTTAGKLALGGICAALLVGVFIFGQQEALLPPNVFHAGAENGSRPLPFPAVDNPKISDGLQTAVLAGGCFWGVQGVFEHVTGVRRVVAGYAGGTKSTAEYSFVKTGNTGHAEAIEVTFDPQQISYGEILRIFFSVAHDPTELNFQGPDVGLQYRSEIFYSDASQREIAQAYIAQLNDRAAFPEKIVTKLGPLKEFYPAEDYHQDYMLSHPNDGYIVHFDVPKIATLQRLFPDIYNAEPITVKMSSEALREQEREPTILDSKI